MKILAVDSSSSHAVAVIVDFSNKKILADTAASTLVSASESLLPLIDEVLLSGAMSLSDLSAMAVGVGPGSFTGLRIGMATMKTLSQVQGIPLAGVSSLRAVALSGPHPEIAIPMINAYQGQVFVGWGAYQDGTWNENSYSLETWWTEIGATLNAVHLVGSGVDFYREVLEGFVRDSKMSVDQFTTGIQMNASGLAAALFERLSAPDALKSPEEIQARYIRPSQASINLANHRRNQGCAD